MPPDTPESNLLLEAIRLRETGKYFEAAELFEKLVNIEQAYADKSHAFFEATKYYHKAFKNNGTLFSKSVDALQKLIRNHSESPHSISAYYYLAWVYWDKAASEDRSYFRSLIKTVDEATRKYSDNEDDLTLDLLRRMKDLKDDAYENLEQNTIPVPIEPIPIPISIKPETKLVEQGYKHFNNNELDKAMKNARNALDINPNYQRGRKLIKEIKNKHFKNGLNYINNSQYQNAIVEFRKTLEIDQNFEKAYCNLGVVYIFLERHTDAVNALNMAISIDSVFKEAHFNLGLAYYELERFEEAQNAINKALQIDPNYDLAKILRDSIIDRLE